MRTLLSTAMAVAALASLAGCGNNGSGSATSAGASTAASTSATTTGVATTSSSTLTPIQGTTGTGTTRSGSTGTTGSTGSGTTGTGTPGSTTPPGPGTINPGGPIRGVPSPTPAPAPTTTPTTGSMLITGMNPVSGVVGTAVSIVVSNFGGATAVVDFNGTTAATPTYAGLNGFVTVSVVVPAGATSGDVHVAITPASGGTATTLDAGSFQVLGPAPTPTGPGFSPAATLQQPRGLHTATVIDGRAAS